MVTWPRLAAAQHRVATISAGPRFDGRDFSVEADPEISSHLVTAASPRCRLSLLLSSLVVGEVCPTIEYLSHLSSFNKHTYSALESFWTTHCQFIKPCRYSLSTIYISGCVVPGPGLASVWCVAISPSHHCYIRLENISSLSTQQQQWCTSTDVDTVSDFPPPPPATLLWPCPSPTRVTPSQLARLTSRLGSWSGDVEMFKFRSK